MTLIRADINYHKVFLKTISLDLSHFRDLLTSKNVAIRCSSAFQVNFSLNEKEKNNDDFR